MKSDSPIAVETVLARNVRRGDWIWVSDDGDWLLVDRRDQESISDRVTFFRPDHSEASFRINQRMLRRAQS